MDAVLAGGVLGDLVGAGQLGEVMPGLSGWNPGQAGGGLDADARAGVQAQQPEHPCRFITELLTGLGEHRPHTGGRVAAIQSIQSIQAAGRVGELGR